MSAERKKLILALAVIFSANIFIIALVQYASADLYKRGSSGDTVREIQTRLKNWGYYSGEVDGIYGSRTEVMRIPVFTQLKYYGPGTYEIWVVNGSRAVKRKVKLGESGFDYIEVADGLSPGEKIIMSDMERYKNKTELRTK